MPTALLKSAPLAEQWAAKHNAEEISLGSVTIEDRMYLDGEIQEFDDNLDYHDDLERRRQRTGLNAYDADSREAAIDSNLIAAAMTNTRRGRDAEEKLRQRGYTINGDFDEARQRYNEDRRRIYEDYE